LRRRWRRTWRFIIGPVGVPQSPWARAADAALFFTLIAAMLFQWYAAEFICSRAMIAHGEADVEWSSKGMTLVPAEPGDGAIQWEAWKEKCGWPFATVIANEGLLASWSLDDPPESRAMGPVSPEDSIASALLDIAPAGVGLTRGEGRAFWGEIFFGTAITWMVLYFAVRIPLVFLRTGMILHTRHLAVRGQQRIQKGKCPSCSYDLTGLDYAAKCPECGTLLW